MNNQDKLFKETLFRLITIWFPFPLSKRKKIQGIMLRHQEIVMLTNPNQLVGHDCWKLILSS